MTHETNEGDFNHIHNINDIHFRIFSVDLDSGPPGVDDIHCM